MDSNSTSKKFTKIIYEMSRTPVPGRDYRVGKGQIYRLFGSNYRWEQCELFFESEIFERKRFRWAKPCNRL